MKLSTARTIKNSYPDNIWITGEQEAISGKWRSSVYLTENKKPKNLLLQSPFAFPTRWEAEKDSRNLCESIVNDKTL